MSDSQLTIDQLETGGNVGFPAKAATPGTTSGGFQSFVDNYVAPIFSPLLANQNSVGYQVANPLGIGNAGGVKPLVSTQQAVAGGAIVTSALVNSNNQNTTLNESGGDVSTEDPGGTTTDYGYDTVPPSSDTVTPTNDYVGYGGGGDPNGSTQPIVDYGDVVNINLPSTTSTTGTDLGGDVTAPVVDTAPPTSDTVQWSDNTPVGVSTIDSGGNYSALTNTNVANQLSQLLHLGNQTSAGVPASGVGTPAKSGGTTVTVGGSTTTAPGASAPGSLGAGISSALNDVGAALSKFLASPTNQLFAVGLVAFFVLRKRKS